MGFISEVSGKDIINRSEGRRVWDSIFGATDKEKPHKSPVKEDGWGRSAVTGKVSYMRLLQAMRSMAPGGWSDDRWEQTRHWVGIAWVAGHRRCLQLQQANYTVYIEDSSHPDGKRPITKDDPGPKSRYEADGWDLVKYLRRPNRQDSFGKFLYRLGQQKILTGTALDWMVPNYYGRPFEHYIVPTCIAVPQPAVNPDYPDGYYRMQPIYPYGPFSSYPAPSSSVGAAVPAQWIMRFQYPHPLLRYDGYSPLTGMRLHMDELEQMDRSRWYSMKRSINPSAVLNFDAMEGPMQPLPEQEISRIHAEWEAEFQGTENHGKLIVGTPGASLDEWGKSPKDMDYPTGWSQLLSFLMGGFGVPKPVAGMVEDVSYAGLFAALKQVHTLDLKPEVDDIAAELTHGLCQERAGDEPPFFGDGNLAIGISLPRIDDHDMAMAKVNTMAQNSLGTVNEARKLLDLPITDEPWGNDRLGMQNMQPPIGMPGVPEGMMGQEQSAVEAQMPAGGVEPPPMPPQLRGREPNGLGEGAWGPRMDQPKSLNGNGVHLTNGARR